MFSKLALIASLAAAESITIPPPSGSFNVGSKAFVLPKITQNDPVAPNGTGTSILVNVYYPTNENGTTQKYIWEGLSATYEEYYSIIAGSFGNTTATIAYGAPSLPSQEWDCIRKPTVLFSPPFAGPPSQLFLALFSELVSNGYTVITNDHPYEQPFLQYPDGTGIPGLAMDFAPPEGFEQFLELTQAYRLSDTSAVIDILPEISEMLDVPLNTTDVVFIGHSLGGSEAINQVLYERNRTKYGNVPKINHLGAVNLDGAIFGPATANDSSADLLIPSLLMAAEMHVCDDSWLAFIPPQTKWTKWLRILERSNHTDFSDLIVMKQANGIAGDNGSISALRMTNITRQYVSDFFDMVSGSRREGVLAGSEAVRDSWPEVQWVYNNTGSLLVNCDE